MEVATLLFLRRNKPRGWDKKKNVFIKRNWNGFSRKNAICPRWNLDNTLNLPFKMKKVTLDF